MKQVSASIDSTELGLLRNMLEQAGIPCSLRNEQLSQALPTAPFNVELWVESDNDFQRARDLCEYWFHPPLDTRGSWACARCGRRHGGQFDSCWSCGAERKTTGQLNTEGHNNENVSRVVD